MSEFILFKHKSNGIIKSYPAHYQNHPVFGSDLEPYVPEEIEEEKVVIERHEIPVEQRIVKKAVKGDKNTKEEE